MLDKKTGDRIMTLVSGLFGKVADSVIQRRLKGLLVLVWENLYTSSRQQFLDRLSGTDFSAMSIKDILSDWDRVVDNLFKFDFRDQKFVKDIQWKRNNHKFYKPKKSEERLVRIIYSIAREKNE